MPGLLLAGFLVLLASGFAALAARHLPGWSARIALTGMSAGALLAGIPAAHVLMTGKSFLFEHTPAFYGHFLIGMDRLSALFTLLILGVSWLTALYGVPYLLPSRKGGSVGISWFFFLFLVVSMTAVVTARDAIFFLAVWELMSLSSYFLVALDHPKEKVRQASMIYLVASQIGAVFLFIFFLKLASGSGSFAFSSFQAGKTFAPAVGTMLFLCALAGFGLKAGLMPFHVWLPQAHPVAPSHVSALMSGVMIKTGIYGILRTIEWLGVPYAWWGWLLLGMGVVSGFLGILFALAQHHLKSLLAYSSVENVGLIVAGVGMGCLGIKYNLPVLAASGFGAALWHTVNHAVFKALLFLGSGAVIFAAGTDAMDRLGGLLKRMPWTGGAFLSGALAISGLPPFNGFISEFLLCFGAFSVISAKHGPLSLPMVVTVCSLALTGALAVVCFVKAFGISFLGSPRSPEAKSAGEAGGLMLFAMLGLSGLCLVFAMASFWVLPLLGEVAEELIPGVFGAGSFGKILLPLKGVVVVFGALLVFSTALLGIRFLLLSGRRVMAGVTWDCGYAHPTARMQYTASSFSEILNGMFRPVIWIREHTRKPEGIFPKGASRLTHPVDTFREGFYDPFFKAVGWGVSRLRWIQHGQLHLYVMYMALTLMFLLMVCLN